MRATRLNGKFPIRFRMYWVCGKLGIYIDGEATNDALISMIRSSVYTIDDWYYEFRGFVNSAFWLLGFFHHFFLSFEAFINDFCLSKQEHERREMIIELKSSLKTAEWTKEIAGAGKGFTFTLHLFLPIADGISKALLPNLNLHWASPLPYLRKKAGN